MKRILFCIHNFSLGGIPRALLSLLPYLTDKYSIDIFCPFQSRPYLKEFSEYNVIPQDNLSVDLYDLKDFWMRSKAFCLKCYSRFCLLVGYDLYLNRMLKWSKVLSGKYDFVVAFSEGPITRMASHIISPQRIAWVHMDYKRVMIYNDAPDAENYYKQFNLIISPSVYSANSFVDIFPNLKYKVKSIPNMLDIGYIRKKSTETEYLDVAFNTKEFKVISVGRICAEKRFYDIPRIVSEIPLNFKWYIIGVGGPKEVNALLSNIETYKVKDKVIYLGGKNNPYPYMKMANLYVSLSISETFSYAIYESKILGTPVLSSFFGGIDEILNDDCSRVVDYDNIPIEISKIISDNSLYQALRLSANNYIYNNPQSKVLSLFN